MKHIITWLIFLQLILGLPGCEGFRSGFGTKAPEPELFVAAAWNVQTLFDGHETGNEFRDFREAAGWTAEKYAARITSISQAIQQMFQEAPIRPPGAVPDLIGFMEIENLTVLEDLAGALEKHGYYWAAFANNPGSAIGIGYLSRFPFTDIRAHSITVEKNTSPRPVLEVRIEVQEKPLVFLLCHWKSKLGGDDATEALRRSSARVVQRRIREIKETEADTPVIVLGDLNVNHDEFYRRSGLIRYALLPDTPEAAALGLGAFGEPLGVQDFLVLSAEKPPRPNYFPHDTHVLYSPWIEDKSGGTYYFRERWETIDHFLLSSALFSGSGWDYAGSQVLDFAPFVTSSGLPASYVTRSGRGLSDHLPLLLYLSFR